MSAMRALRRGIKRSGETAGQNLKPAKTTTNCFSCRRVIRIDRARTRFKNLCPQCDDKHPGSR